MKKIQGADFYHIECRFVDVGKDKPPEAFLVFFGEGKNNNTLYYLDIWQHNDNHEYSPVNMAEPYGKNIFRLAGFERVLVRLDLTLKEWCDLDRDSVG